MFSFSYIYIIYYSKRPFSCTFVDAKENGNSKKEERTKIITGSGGKQKTKRMEDKTENGRRADGSLNSLSTSK